jgi:polyisoprenoid-binding protein YceI
MKRLLAAGVAAVLLSMPAAAEHWAVDASKSRLGFTVMWSGEPLNGVFKKWSAAIAFDPADLAHSNVVAVIDTASIATDYADGDDGIKGALGFAVDKFPTARFETIQIKPGPGGTYVAEARLTIRGITRPVTLPFKLEIQGGRAHVEGKATVMRSDFGVGQGEWADTRPVAHEITVTLDLTATKS